MKHYCVWKKIRVIKDKLPCYSKNECTMKSCYVHRALSEPKPLVT